MWRNIFILVFSLVSLCCHAKTIDCQQINTIINKHYPSVPHPLWGQVINNKSYFYSAPNKACINKKLFIIKGDFVTIYTPYDKWLSVMFINSRTGDDFMGWVLANTIKIE
ncbi:MAG: hypothetical protein WAX77_14690 [Methylococcaceae bacterium]